jgi:hypothetical protein
LGEIEAHLAATQVEPGIPYYDARRELWLDGKKKKPRSDQVPASIKRFEEMVRDPRALRSKTVWETGLGRVSKRLMEGGRLRYGLPMHLLVYNTVHSARAFIPDMIPGFTDKNIVCGMDLRWNMAIGPPGARVR